MACASWCLFFSYIFNYLFAQQLIIPSTPPPPLLLTWRKEICTLLLLVACTTLGNYTDDIYRGVPIKNSRTSVTISSPNFPKHYPRDIQCTWRIQAPESSQVQLSFLEFQLEKQSLDLRCHDYISLRSDALLLSIDYCSLDSENSQIQTSDSGKSYKRNFIPSEINITTYLQTRRFIRSFERNKRNK